MPHTYFPPSISTKQKADFLRYLEYEINLDELRRLRKAKLGLTKSTKADFAGQQLVHFIFERALRKFRCVFCFFFVPVYAW